MAASALLFPGQGSHAEGMDAPYRGLPIFERGLEILGFDPFERLGEGTRAQQPALFLCSVAAWDAWRRGEGGDDAAEVGPEDVVAAAGHSLGEYAALVAAGAIAFEDAVGLVAERGAAMDDAGRAHPGGMLALLGGDARAVGALADRLGLTVANDNAPGQLVLSGPLGALDAAEAVAREETGARARRLDVSGGLPLAAHGPRRRPPGRRPGRHAGPPPALTVFANGSAAPFVDVRAELAAHLLQPVRWRETLLALRAAGVERFVELGPGAVLTSLVKRTLAAA